MVSGSAPTLTSADDVLKMMMNLEDAAPNGMDRLDPGETVTLQITTSAGGSTDLTLTEPNSLDSENAVPL